jgi:hypothetical protein
VIFMTCHRKTSLISTLLLVTTALLCLTSCISSDWRTATRKSAGIAADPALNKEAILQVYSADAWGWRGWFAIHTWIAVKPTDALSYTVYEVIGWRQNRGLPVVRIENDLPDRYWYGERPELLKEFHGEGVDRLITAVDKAAQLSLGRALRSFSWAEQQHLHRLGCVTGA